MKIDSVMHTDVLVLGGGIAGIRAAIEAHDHGVSVILANKGPFGRDGAAVWMAGDGYQAALYPPDSVDQHIEDTVKGGHFLSNQVLVKTFLSLAPQTVEVSGNIDFFTPAEFATDELLPALSNGQQVILSEFGHTSDVYSLQPEATRHLLNTFFATGKADDSLFVHHTVSFKATMSFPAMAKLIVAAIVLVIIIVIAVVWFIAQRGRVRQRRAAQVSS